MVNSQEVENIASFAYLEARLSKVVMLKELKINKMENESKRKISKRKVIHDFLTQTKRHKEVISLSQQMSEKDLLHILA